MADQQNRKGPPPARRPAPKTWEDYFAGIEEWLNYHWGDEHPCSGCGGTTWTIGSALALPVAVNWPAPPDSPIGGISPYAPISCVQCTYTVFVAALWIFEPQTQAHAAERPSPAVEQPSESESS
jgi:hypothetical protein